MMVSNMRVVISGVLLSLIVQEIGAAPIEVEFSGVIDFVEDPDNELDASVIVGAPFTGDFIYDPVGAVDHNASSKSGSYNFPSPISFQIGNMAFLSEELDISVAKLTSFDAVSFFDNLFSVAGFDDEVLMAIEFRDESGTALDSDGLPTSIDLADFPDYRRFQFIENNVPDMRVQVEGEVTSITFIPEPATALLLALAGLLPRRRRSRPHSVCLGRAQH